MHGTAKIYVVRVEGRVPGGFSDPSPATSSSLGRKGDAEILALHEALVEQPDADAPSVSGSAASSREAGGGGGGDVLEAVMGIEASSFGEAAERAAAAYRAAVLHAHLGSASSISEGAAVVRVEVCTEEEFDRRMPSGELDRG